MPSRPFCCLWHHWPWNPDLMPVILVWYSWLCSELVWIISILPCEMWQLSIFLVYLFLWCSSGLCSRSFSLHHVYLGPRLDIPVLTPVLSSLTFLSITTFMQITFNSALFIHLTQTSHLHNALQQISSWMITNLLTLNPSKTEFPWIGLSKQLAEINNTSLSTTISARNVDNMHVSSSNQISYPNPAIITPVNFVASILTSTSKQPLTSLTSPIVEVGTCRFIARPHLGTCRGIRSAPINLWGGSGAARVTSKPTLSQILSTIDPLFRTDLTDS